jgi:glycosyltransferase involved in cell wall biosynthesis
LADQLSAAGVPLTVIGKRWKFDPRSYQRLEQHVRELRPDIVQTWLFAANAYGRVAALRAGVPIILGGERSVDPWKSGYQFAIDRFLAHRSRGIVVNSRGVSDFYAQHGIPEAMFRVIPNGVTLPPPATRTKDELLAELGLSAGTRLIAAVGRLWPQKRVKDVIWAADLLKVLYGDVHVLIIGDGPERARLERFRRLCEIEDRVHFLGERSDVPQILPHCALLWLASGYEGLPNVVLEAMAVGIPVVATDIPGTRDLVVPGETGYLVPIGDRAGLAKYANVLLERPEEAAQLGAAGRIRVAEQFSVEAMVARFAAMYRELLAGRGGS